MSTIKSYHYVYRITNIILNKHYYGKRSSKVNPKLDLSIKYFSSSIDKEFIQDQKANPQNYKYKIVSCYNSAEKALQKEIKLHAKFNVGVNPNFYNRAKQTSVGFDSTGKIPWNQGKSHTTETRKKIGIANSNRIWSAKAKEKLSIARTGRIHMAETRKKISLANTGRIVTNETRKKLSIANIKIANIYKYSDNSLVASGVCLSVWTRENGYNNGGLSSTLKADRTKPHHWKNNPHQYKGIYAKHIN